MADACIAAGLQVPELDAPTRKSIDAHLPSYGTSQNPIDGTAQAVHKLGYAGMAELVVDSPSIDSVIVVMSGRAGQRVVEERDTLLRVKRNATKPILMWSYTLPAPETITTLAEVGLSAFHEHAQLCANAGGDVVLRGGARALPDSTRGSQRGAATARERRSWSARSGSGAHRSAIQANAGRLRHLPGR